MSEKKHGPEELPDAQGQGWPWKMPGCDGAVAAERSYPMYEVRGGDPEEQPHHQGAAAARCRRAKRSYSTFKVRRGDLAQSKEQWLGFAGAAMKTYPKSKVRKTQVRW